MIQTNPAILSLSVDEITQVLEFAAGPVRSLYHRDMRPSLLAFQTENAAQRAWMTTILATSFLEVCRARHITPFDSIEPVFLMVQSLLSTLVPPPAMALDELSAQDAQKVLDDHYKMVTLSKLPVVVANSFSVALNNTTNTASPVTQLIKLSSLVAEMMLQLDHMMTGNQWAYGLAEKCLADLKQLRTELPDTTYVLVDTIIRKFMEVTNANDTV